MMVAAMLASSAGSVASASHRNRFDSYTWTEVNGEASWGPRAGLETVALGRNFYLLGGRSPNPWVAPPEGPIPGDSTIWGDVWRSRDRGESWERILETDDTDHWPARAYHEVVTKGRKMYVLGGQNFGLIPDPSCEFDPDCFPKFVSTSEFFNDVWSSRDDRHWTQLTAEAPWHGRAGLSAIVFRDEIYVMGGSFNDDPDIVGGPPTRVVLNDVWKDKYDYDTIVAPSGPDARGRAIYTFGGGRETFDFFDPIQWLNVDDDVWRFALPKRQHKHR